MDELVLVDVVLDRALVGYARRGNAAGMELRIQRAVGAWVKHSRWMLWALALGACHRGEQKEAARTAAPATSSAPTFPAVVPSPGGASATDSQPWHAHASVASRYLPDPSCSPPPRVPWPDDASPHWRRLAVTCDAGDMDACRRAGDVRASGDGGPSDAQHALSLFRRACDGGNESACANVAEHYDAGLGTLPNETCRGIFEVKAKGEAASNTSWWGEDTVALKKACADGAWAACVWAEQPWSDPLKQVGAYCARGLDHACWVIRRVGAETAELTQTYVEACQHGSRYACSELLYPERSKHRQMSGALVRSGQRPPEPAFSISDRPALVRTACENGLGHACHEVARQDPTKALTWLARGCPSFPRDHEERDVDPDACVAWGDALLAAGEADAPFRAAAAYQRGCYVRRYVWGREKACLALAKLLAEGRGELRPDPARAEFVGADLCSIDTQHCRRP